MTRARSYTSWMEEDYEIRDDFFNPVGPRDFDEEETKYEQQWDEPFDF